MKKVNWEKMIVTFMRCAVGWHLLYGGVSKFFADNWTATEYLSNAQGPFAGFYHWLGSSDGLMVIIDPLNIYGLILIGLGLFVGLAVSYAAVAAIVLLAFYYFAYPPFGGSLAAPADRSLYIVNRIFIEICVLLSLLFVKEKGYGLYALKLFSRKKATGQTDNENRSFSSRRQALKNMATLPVLGILGAGAFRAHKTYGTDAMSGATIKTGALDISKLRAQLPKGKIGAHEISRLVLGGNMIGGWAHSRDLIYVPALFRAYNTEGKIFETLMLAEKAGINSINIGFPSNPVLEKYKKMTGSKIKVISQVAAGSTPSDYDVNINKAIDYGVDIIQIQGNCCDWLVRDNKIDIIGKMMDKIRSQGYVAGLASHTIDSLIACEEHGIIPDYYMKTMHHDRYWSAHPKENRVPFEVDGKNSPDHNKYHNNMFCLFPERSVEFVQRAKVPVMGYKILAAGAIKPQDGINWAFKNGADFICVGMFDFQVVHDVNITINVLNNLKERRRQWYG